MKSLLLTAACVLTLLACHTKKSEPVAAAPASEVKTPPSPPPLPAARPANGVYEPGEVELAEIHKKDSTVTMAKLQEGYFIYAKGQCIRCHGAANIYGPPESRWPGLLGDMAMRAGLTAAQKDAVSKYVMAIRAVKQAGK